MAEKIWFITGASRGLGRVWAEAALTRGDKVVATARNVDSVADLREWFGDAALPLSLGSSVLPTVRAAYADRLKTWEAWETVSNGAQGEATKRDTPRH